MSRGAGQQFATTTAAPHTQGPGCEIWGALNVTPDSFSDGGLYLRPQDALEHALAMLEAGAHVIDVGGESSRPAGTIYGEGFAHVSVAEELSRVLPVVEALAQRGHRVSVDTVKPEVAEAALGAGAQIINDISGGASDALLKVVARSGAELVLMHNRGKGEVKPPFSVYDNLVAEVRDELLQAQARAERAGVLRERIWLDPGIGFAKTAAQSLTLLARLPALVSLGQRVLVGPSRKSFIAASALQPDGSLPGAQQRLGGTLASVLASVEAGAHAVRVHDVAETWQALSFARALDTQRGANRSQVAGFERGVADAAAT